MYHSNNKAIKDRCDYHP